MSVLDPRPTLEAPDDDPYLWLEEIETVPVLDWVEAQNAATLKRFLDEAVSADRKILKAIFDRPDNIPFPNRRAGRLFNPWRDAANPRGLWRTTTLESFCSDAPNWDVLIDVDALAAKEGEDWVWRGGDTLPPTHDRAIVYLSRGGQMLSCCANSIYRRGTLCRMGSACLSQRAVLSGSTVIRCFYRPRSGPAWRPEAAMRAPFDCGSVEAIRCRPPSSSKQKKNPLACGPLSTGRFRGSAPGS